MASKQMVYMNQGQGETSYACNSRIQVSIADLGCSSGSNALVLVSVAVEAISSHCIQFQQPPPEVCVLLNDLPGNDFNMVVKSLVTLRERSNPIVMTGVTPGSFYERLFTSGSMHLFCTSNSVHWLSEAPDVLRRNQIPAYDIDEHVRREKLPTVIEAYAQQFKKDFKHFLELRATELVQGGQMVLSLPGRHHDSKYHHWEIFVQILRVMASEGVIDRAKFDSFYVPVYAPSDQELREIIQEEGSFWTKDMLVHDFTISVDSSPISATWVANQMRATFEPIVLQHFGEVMDEFVRTAERRWSQEGSLQDEFGRYPIVTLTVSLTKAQ